MKNKQNIILIGFMGSGKSTVAKSLAKKLYYPLIDTDSLIEKNEGKSINDIFSVSENHFRSLETKICQDIKHLSGHIISTGGGIIKSEENRQLLKLSGFIVFLNVHTDTILKRLKHDLTRPLLNVKNKKQAIQTLITERQPLYESIASIQIDTNTRSINDISAMIIKSYENYGKTI